jgi:hypothetical protein
MTGVAALRSPIDPSRGDPIALSFFIRGDTREVLAGLAGAGVVVDLVVTSPPFLGLRSYLPAGHADKSLEIGNERSPGEFIDVQLDVIEACDRLLAPHGSIVFELGDTYAGSGGAGGDYGAGGLREGQAVFAGSAARSRADGNGRVFRGGQRLPDGRGTGWPAPKSQCLIPELFRVALAYGVNPLTGRTTPCWRVRNTVSWCRTNPPVGRDGDKFRPAQSDLVIVCRTDEDGRRRYWDGEAVRTSSEYERPNLAGRGSRRSAADPPGLRRNQSDHTVNPAGAPLRDWWVINNSGYPGAHYATFPPGLVEPLIKTMCPPRVCTTCGQPSRRIAEARNGVGKGFRRTREPGKERAHSTTDTPDLAVRETIGWTDCGHKAWRPGIVLDPYSGTGTTLAVATGHGAIGIGIDLDERNVELARDRIGPLLFREATVSELAESLATGPIAFEARD